MPLLKKKLRISKMLWIILSSELNFFSWIRESSRNKQAFSKSKLTLSNYKQYKTYDYIVSLCNYWYKSSTTFSVFCWALYKSLARSYALLVIVSILIIERGALKIYGIIYFLIFLPDCFKKIEMIYCSPVSSRSSIKGCINYWIFD